MALTPGLYVPQGQVGTGAAYVHEIKDRSGYLDAIAKASEKQRVDREKQLAKLKGFDYGKVSDPTMKAHISKIYQDGLTDFAKITALGGDISNVTTREGIAYAKWQEQIEDEAFTAAQAETKKQEFRNKVDNPQYGVDPMMVYTVMEDYDNAQTPDEKLAATQSFDPTLLRDFPYNDWISEEIDKAEKDKEIVNLDKDSVDYQNVFNGKLKEIPLLLASKESYKIAKKQWEVRHNKGETGFGQNSFDEFLDERIENERKMRENKQQAARTSISMTTNVGGGSTPVNATAQQLTTGSQGQAINFPDLNAAFSGGDSNGKLAFWTADPGGSRVPLLVLKGGTDNPTDYGLSKNIATANRSDNQAIVIKGSNLWQLRTADPPVTLQPADVSKLSVTFKDKNFTDENGNATGGEGSLIYKDQLGNKWLDLVDEASNPRHVLIETGGLAQTYQDAYGKVVTNPLVGIAEANRNALAKALGVSWQEFSDKYFRNNLK